VTNPSQSEAVEAAKRFVTAEANRFDRAVVSYAQQLEQEAYAQARRYIQKHTADPALVEAQLNRLEALHARNLAMAAEAVAPSTLRGKHHPLVASMVTDAAVIPAANNLIAEAIGDEENQ
jgi:hypothetical protein